MRAVGRITKIDAPPSIMAGLAAAVAVNVTAGVVFWLAITSIYSVSGSGSLSYQIKDWIVPVALFLGLTALAGLVAVAVGWRRFGLALVAGAIAVGLLDLAWWSLYVAQAGG